MHSTVFKKFNLKIEEILIILFKSVFSLPRYIVLDEVKKKNNSFDLTDPLKESEGSNPRVLRTTFWKPQVYRNVHSIVTKLSKSVYALKTLDLHSLEFGRCLR